MVTLHVPDGAEEVSFETIRGDLRRFASVSVRGRAGYSVLRYSSSAAFSPSGNAVPNSCPPLPLPRWPVS